MKLAARDKAVAAIRTAIDLDYGDAARRPSPREGIMTDARLAASS